PDLKRGHSRAGRAGAHELARLLKRVFDIDIEHCPSCGALKKPPPTQADGAARSEFDRAARSPAPSAPVISAPPPTLPSKTATLTQPGCALTGSARGVIRPRIKRCLKNPVRPLAPPASRSTQP